MSGIESCFLKRNCLEGQVCNQGGPDSVNRLFWFLSCFCAILLSMNFSLVVNQAHISPEETLSSSFGGFWRGGDFWNLSHAIDLNFAEAYCVLFLNTCGRPLFWDYLCTLFLCHKFKKESDWLQKNVFKKLDGNATRNLEKSEDH